MDTHPKTIQIFLPHGEPRGIRIAEITTRVARAILIPRARLTKAVERQELQGVGVYFLFGESEDDAKSIVYVGEAENCYHRLGQHNRSKDFWNTAIVITSKTSGFTKAHAKYLEWYCLNKAKEVGRFEIENSMMPNEPHVTETMQADLMDSFETLSILVSTLGFPTFDPVRRIPVSTSSDSDGDDDLFFCTRNNVNAEGRLLDDGFVVYEGSRLSPDVTGAGVTHVNSIREKLLQK